MGFYFLFAPVIALLKWIPLVGWLLGGIFALAAFIFALVVGLLLSTLTIAIAWVFYRPLVGLLLFAAVGVGIFLIFSLKGADEALDSTGLAGEDAVTPQITAA